MLAVRSTVAASKLLLCSRARNSVRRYFGPSSSLHTHTASSLKSCAVAMTTTTTALVDVTSRRSFSFYSQKQHQGNYNSTSKVRFGAPSYQVYGEEAAFSLRTIPPEFRTLDSGTVVLNSKASRGKFLLQWTPRGSDGRYLWDMNIRFALTAEEAASVFLARLDPQKLLILEYHNNKSGTSENLDGVTPLTTVAAAEVVRRNTEAGHGSGIPVDHEHGSGFPGDHEMPEKVFRARLQGDGSVELTVDYELDGIGGHTPPTNTDVRGPLTIHLMVGEYHVIRSIIQYSLPGLVGWSPMFDSSLEQAANKGSTKNTNYGNIPSPHNYQGNDYDNVPF